MRIKIVTILALLSCSVANAQSIIDQVYKTISPEHGTSYKLVQAHQAFLKFVCRFAIMRQY